MSNATFSSKTLGYSHYELEVWEDADTGHEYAIAINAEDALEAAKTNIKDSLWAFKASFLVDYMDIADNLSLDGTQALIDMVSSYQQKKCEDASNDIYQFIKENFDAFVEDAITSDGIGHFLAPYDGEEVEYSSLSEDLISAVKDEYDLDDEEITEILAYRIN